MIDIIYGKYLLQICEVGQPLSTSVQTEKFWAQFKAINSFTNIAGLITISNSKIRNSYDLELNNNIPFTRLSIKLNIIKGNIGF